MTIFSTGPAPAGAGPASAVGGAQDQTADFLRLLFNYVTAQAPSFPGLLPSIGALNEAAQRYGAGDQQGAFRRGKDAYDYIMRVRASEPRLPLP